MSETQLYADVTGLHCTVHIPTDTLTDVEKHKSYTEQNEECLLQLDWMYKL